jgi:hypothetical protein
LVEEKVRLQQEEFLEAEPFGFWPGNSSTVNNMYEFS